MATGAERVPMPERFRLRCMRLPSDLVLIAFLWTTVNLKIEHQKACLQTARQLKHIGVRSGWVQLFENRVWVSLLTAGSWYQHHNRWWHMMNLQMITWYKPHVPQLHLLWNKLNCNFEVTQNNDCPFPSHAFHRLHISFGLYIYVYIYIYIYIYIWRLNKDTHIHVHLSMT